MFFVFLVVVAALGIAVYLVFIFKLVPGAAEERLGVLEPLPDDIGQWKPDESSAEAKASLAQGQLREERLFFEEGKGLMAQGRLVRQVRYRNVQTSEIDRVEPDQPVKRRRIRA
jgi:hypothetical protein